MSIRPGGPPDSDWYSICSMHGEYQESCGLCNAGHWVSRVEQTRSHRLWMFSPWLWRQIANMRDNPSADHLEELFPKLKGGHNYTEPSQELVDFAEVIMSKDISSLREWLGLRWTLFKLRRK